jgi:hypothetical protein
MTTTAFCTVDRVTSAGRTSSCDASICLVHDMPNNDVADSVSDAGRKSVKYEKSSVALQSKPRDQHGGFDTKYRSGVLTRGRHRSKP